MKSIRAFYLLSLGIALTYRGCVVVLEVIFSRINIRHLEQSGALCDKLIVLRVLLIASLIDLRSPFTSQITLLELKVSELIRTRPVEESPWFDSLYFKLFL